MQQSALPVRDAEPSDAGRLSSDIVLRPAPGGIKGWLMSFTFSTGLPLLFRLLPWNARLGMELR